MEPVRDSSLILELNGACGKNSPATSTWKDLSGHDNDGTLSGFGYVAGSGWSGDGLEFDGVNDYVDCGNKAIFDFTGEFTLEFIMFHKNLASTWEWFMAKNSNSSASEGYYVGYYADGHTIAFYANSKHVDSGLVPQANTMYHIFAVYKPSQYLKLVVNGTTYTNTEAIPASILPNLTHSLTIGRTMYYASTFIKTI